MALLITVFESATGKPVYQSWGPDNISDDPTQTVITEEHGFIDRRLDRPGGPEPAPPGPDELWLINGSAVLRSSLGDAAEVAMSGLTVSLSAGHLFTDFGHFENTESDSHTFDSPAQDLALAVDIMKNDAADSIQLAYYTWDPAAVPAEDKGDPPSGYTVVQADVLRGILPAEAADLSELQPEEA